MPAHKKHETQFEYNRYPGKIAIILEVKALHRRGFAVKAIAEMTRLSRTTVHRYLNSTVDENSLEDAIKNGRTKPGRKVKYYQPIKNTKIPETDNPIEFFESPELLNIKLFPMQKLILKCFYGLELDAEERSVLKKLEKEGRTTYKGKKKYRELVVNAGMKGGKTPLVGFISCWEEYELYKIGDISKYYGFLPGKEIEILNVAVNAEQAQKTIFAEIKARIENSPYYNLHRPIDSTETHYKFSNNVTLQSGHSNSSSLVGPLRKLVSFDELSKFVETKSGKYSADRVYDSLSKGIAGFEIEDRGIYDGRIASISSPLFSEDKICTLYKQSETIDNMLGFHLPTWELNPHLNFNCEYLQTELKKNPEGFWRDYGARASLALEAYFKIPEKIDSVFKMNMKNPISKQGILDKEFKPKPGYEYFMHADPSAKNDAFGLGMAHGEGDRVIVDLAHRFLPKGGEIDVNDVLYFIIELLNRGFNIKKFTYDTWQATAIIQALSRRNVPCENMYIDKMVYDRFKEIIYQGKVDTYFQGVLSKELKALELLSGKKIDHPSKGSKDIADAVAGAAWNVVEHPVVEIAYGGSDVQTEQRIDKRFPELFSQRFLNHQSTYEKFGLIRR